MKKERFKRNCFPNSKIYILEFNQCMKSDKMLYIIYNDIELLVKKTDNCKNNPENSSTTKIGKHVGIRAFDLIEIIHSLYHGKNCLKNFCESLREHTKYIMDFEKKKCYR